MIIIDSVAELKEYLNERKGKIGFVPTMGALHDGHLSLVKTAMKKSDVVVVSVFVNPTQFNDKGDLDKYPRTLDKDAGLLSSIGTNVLFAPTEKEVYPPGLSTKVKIDLGQLDKVMEGQFRPGHFEGVLEVVNRLLTIVDPDYLFMGQKDFQQFTIIHHMINVLNIKTQLVVCPIKREANGLARSSRNERLSPESRNTAGQIYKALKSIKRRRKIRTFDELTIYAEKKFNRPPFKMEYIAFVDGYTLQPVLSILDSTYIVVCIVVWVDDVRLIDNIILKKED